MLGLEEQTRHHDEAGLRSVWLRLDGSTLMIERGASGSGGWHLLALEIDPRSRESWRVRLVEASAYTHHSAYTIYGRDPDDNPFGLSHFPERGG